MREKRSSRWVAKRHKMLWERYNENGQKLTWAECQDIMGVKRADLAHLKGIFASYGLEAPPVWGDPPVKYLRISRELCAKFPMGNEEWEEMARILGIGKWELYYQIGRIRAFGYDLPGTFATPKIEVEPDPPREIIPEDEFAFRVTRGRELPDGKIVYRLR